MRLLIGPPCAGDDLHSQKLKLFMNHMILRFNCFRCITQMMICVLLTGFVAAELPKDVLGKLGSDQFEVRQKAYAELKEWSVGNLKTSPSLLYKVWAKSKDPEVKSRCYVLMKEAAIVRHFGKGQGFVGIVMSAAVIAGKEGEPDRSAVGITEVRVNTPAEKSGLKVGDIILGIDDCDFHAERLKQALDAAHDGKPKVIPRADPRMGNFQLLRDPVVDIMGDYIKSKHPGDEVTLHMFRQGKKIEQKLMLMKRPAYANVDRFGRMLQDPRKEGDDFFEDWLKKMEK